MIIMPNCFGVDLGLGHSVVPAALAAATNLQYCA
jgi:hypothetical protein